LNWSLNTYNFPVRGLLTYDEMEMIQGSDSNDNGGTYSVNTMYGKGLVNAHLKCDDQNWAGTTVDISVSEWIKAHGLIHQLERVAIKTMVPYKKKIEHQQEEYALRLVSAPLNEIAFANLQRDIHQVFEADNKGLNDRAIEMLNNTLLFAEKFKES
jgi:hypothetical protein